MWIEIVSAYPNGKEGKEAWFHVCMLSVIYRLHFGEGTSELRNLVLSSKRRSYIVDIPQKRMKVNV